MRIKKKKVLRWENGKELTQQMLPTPVCLHYPAWTDHTLLPPGSEKSRTTFLWHLQTTCLT